MTGVIYVHRGHVRVVAICDLSDARVLLNIKVYQTTKYFHYGELPSGIMEQYVQFGETAYLN